MCVCVCVYVFTRKLMELCFKILFIYSITINNQNGNGMAWEQATHLTSELFSGIFVLFNLSCCCPFVFSSMIDEWRLLLSDACNLRLSFLSLSHSLSQIAHILTESHSHTHNATQKLVGNMSDLSSNEPISRKYAHKFWQTNRMMKRLVQFDAHAHTQLRRKVGNNKKKE